MVTPQHRIDIVSTLGPSLATRQTLAAVIRAGSRIFRQNVFYESTEEIAQRAQALRQAGRDEGIEVALLMDFSGGRPRMGSFEHPVNLRPGELLTFHPADSPSSATHASLPLSIDEEAWARIKEGERIIIADGRILLRILSRQPGRIRCRIDRAAAPLRPFRGVNLPDTDATFPPLTQEEIGRLEGLAEVGFDYFSLSFARKADDLHQVRRLLESLSPHDKPIRLLAKIEDRQGIENLDALIDAADGILVGRGDLAVQTSFAELPELQEMILSHCRERGAWVVVATQFMETMMRSPIPNRAEVIDVALAVRQGASAILLSGETARGRYPVETVAMVREVAQRAAERD